MSLLIESAEDKKLLDILQREGGNGTVPMSLLREAHRGGDAVANLHANPTLSPWWKAKIAEQSPENAKLMIDGLRKVYIEKMDQPQGWVNELDLMYDHLEDEEMKASGLIEKDFTTREHGRGNPS